MAIIACPLVALWTGKNPMPRTYEMICFYSSSLASEEELLAHIEKIKSSILNRRFTHNAPAVDAA
ncbi:MAG: hypothetical protein GXP29_13515 [Planctomycetes bacterium]|nr:hypothetical protein [Planctomycetota bacterium]